MHPVSLVESVMLFLKDFLFASNFLHRIATWQIFKAFGSGKLTGSGWIESIWWLIIQHAKLSSGELCDFLKGEKKNIRAQSGSYASADCKCGQVHDEILVFWLWALYSTSRVTHQVSCWPEVELSETDGLPRERDILEASPPLSAVLHSTGISQKQRFQWKMLVFQLHLVFHIRMMPCGPENKETCWLVSEDAYLWILYLEGQ